MRERNLLLLLWLLVALCADVRAHAQDARPPTDAEKRAAATHFTRGAQLFQDGVFRAALVELQRAYDIAPNYRVLFNIGQTREALGEFVEASAAYQAYLERGGNAIEPARRISVQHQLAEMTKRIAALEIVVDRDGAVLSIDDVEIGSTPLTSPVKVNVGEHRITARTSDGATGSAFVEVAGGDLKRVTVKLVAPVAAVTVARDPGAPAPAEPSLSGQAKWGIGLLSAAAGLGIAGGVLALVASAKHDDYERALSTLPGDPIAIDDAHDELARVSIATDALLGTAVVAGICGAIVLTLGLRTKKRDGAASARSDLRLGITPRSIVAEGRF